MEGTYFLASRSEVPDLLSKAEKEGKRILGELKEFMIGDIGIRMYEVQHTFGWSIAGDLTVNGELCRSYDPVDLCFLELNELMINYLLREKDRKLKVNLSAE